MMAQGKHFAKPQTRSRISKPLLFGAYSVVWAAAVAAFWLGGRADAMGYSIIALYIVLPLAAVVVAFLMGKTEGFSLTSGLLLIFVSVMYMLASYLTFSLANMIAFEHVNMPDLAGLVFGAACGAIGLLLGSIVRVVSVKLKRG